MKPGGRRRRTRHRNWPTGAPRPWDPETTDPLPIFVPDIDQTDESAHVRATIRAEGIRALAFIPLTAKGIMVGKFIAYHADVHDYSEHQKALAITVARQLGFSLERARAERARLGALRDLRESEERFRLMAEHAPVMIWMCDPQGRCLHLNQMLRRFWQVKEDEAGAFDWRTSMHPDDVELVMGEMGAALARRQSVRVTGRYRNAAGEYRILDTVANPRFAADGTFMGLTVVNTDITERERAAPSRGGCRRWRRRMTCSRAPIGRARRCMRRQAHDGMARTGRADLTFDPAGVVCTIEMPISETGGHACLG